MTTEESDQGKNDRKRLNYLKARNKDLKLELAAVRKETDELREKLGRDKKPKKARAAKE